jgi:NADP-dependent 3-hydroxy acid dehydrogenase YdfG
MVTQQLDGTVALVTGASSGIGEAAALALAERGAGVAVVGRRADRLDALVDRVRRQGGTAVALQADVSDQGQAQDAVERSVEALGRRDTLVNSAGVMLLGPLVDAPLEDWQRMVEVNLLGLLYCSHAALPHLLRAAENGPRRVADLVNISSVAGREVRQSSGVYNATKHGVDAFSEALRLEVTARARLADRAGGPSRPSSPATTVPRSVPSSASASGPSNGSRPATSPTRSSMW